MPSDQIGMVLDAIVFACALGTMIQALRTDRLLQRMEILSLLARHGELTGLELVRRGQHIRRGSVYVLLGKLEYEGLVVSEPLTIAGVRRIYRLAGAR